jgi:DNA-directed RNA polymerase subunit RPC12/RpoP
MANYHCPQCKAAIRGATLFKMQRISKSERLPGKSIRCPQCKSLLAVLTNWWAIVGFAMALLAFTTRMLLDKNAYPTLSIGLVVMQMAGLLLGVIAIWYLQSYSSLQRSAPNISQAYSGELKARKTLLGLFAAWIVLDVVLAAIGGTVLDGIRIIMTPLLMYFVVQGKRWARIITIGLFGLGALGCVAFGIWNFQNMRTPAYIMIGFGVLMSVIPLYMLLSKDLQRYFTWKQSKAPL